MDKLRSHVLLSGCLAITLVVVVANSMTAVGAFQIGQSTSKSTRVISSSNTVIPTTTTTTTTPTKIVSPFYHDNHSRVVMSAAKNTKKKQPPTETTSSSSEKEELDGWKLFLAYATPWRNPNSGLLYMILLLYALGKYSESHPHGGGLP